MQKILRSAKWLQIPNARLQSFFLRIVLAGGGVFALCLLAAAVLTYLSIPSIALMQSFWVFTLLQSMGTIAGSVALIAIVLSLLTAKQ